jgi:glyoxylase-like metal-dependent hydrolase (beta-lactamase superfamily II)
MKEVAPRIFLIEEKGTFKTIKPPENVYVIAGSDGLIFDAGYGNNKSIKHFLKEFNEIRKIFEEKGQKFNITRILPSHCHPDHFSGLKKIAEQLGIHIMLTEKMRQIIKDKKSFLQNFNGDSYNDYLVVKRGMRRKLRNAMQIFFSRMLYERIYGLEFVGDPDVLIEQNSKLAINGEEWVIFPSPGHSKDHISLYNESQGILLAGDNVLSSITTWLGPPNSDIDKYVESIAYIHELPNLKIILPAHGDIITDPIQRTREILQHRKERTQQVIDIIKRRSKEGTAPNDIIAELYLNGKRFLHQVARGWVCLTLKSLEKKGMLVRKETKHKILFFPQNN